MGLYRGGRPKGAKNKSTNLHAKCESVGLDVFARMLELALGEKDKPGEWGKLRELAQYLYAKPKDPGDIQLSADQIRDWIREQNAKPSGS